MNERESIRSKTRKPHEDAAVLDVAYHAGPPEIVFCGRDWQRGVSQAVTAVEWERMQLRGDFGEFDFRAERTAT